MATDKAVGNGKASCESHFVRSLHTFKAIFAFQQVTKSAASTKDFSSPRITHWYSYGTQRCPTDRKMYSSAMSHEECETSLIAHQVMLALVPFLFPTWEIKRPQVSFKTIYQRGFGGIGPRSDVNVYLIILGIFRKSCDTSYVSMVNPQGT